MNTRYRYRWLDIGTCALVCAAVLGLVAAVMGRIPA